TKRKQEGISFFLLDMKTPGIRIRPLVTIDDHHHFNETFFENVFVPKENLVGELDKGWTVAKALLDYERFNSIMGNPIVLGRAIDQVKQSARESAQNGGVVWDDPDLRRQVVGMEMDTDCIRYTRYRSLSKIARGDKPGPEAFLFKFYGTVLFWRILEAHQQVLGTAGIAWNDEPLGALMGEVARHNCTIRASGLRGGTNEVQKNVVAKRILGLPD
ncbi:MAG: pimeloyl-CoA dehydrogenase large subunit, partial [Candidatus Lambdaproteobacteria bacterium]|nr:pimeloyl-CoA dehydrogenase large subunit [Candidatus Lambdaproteobacteria bacterium]